MKRWAGWSSAGGVVLALGAAVAKSTAKVWLGDRQVAADAAAQAVDLQAGRTAGAMQARGLRRLFEQMEEIVAEQLAPLAEHEFRECRSTSGGRRWTRSATRSAGRR